LNLCPSNLVYSHIWLNLPRGDQHFFLHLAMDDRQLGYMKKFLKKNTDWDENVTVLMKGLVFFFLNDVKRSLIWLAIYIARKLY